MWMGVAGIVGTALLPWITERLRSKTARRDQLVKLRLAIYADLLRATARLAATATTSAASHPNDADEIAGDEFDSLLSQRGSWPAMTFTDDSTSCRSSLGRSTGTS